MKKILTIIFSATFITVSAQDSTKKQQSVEIISSYKPVLRNAVKIFFSATNADADTSKNVQPYKIPQQNLFYAYKPISLKPLAMQQDTSLQLGNRNFVKAGFGNFTTPYFSAGISLGDARKSLLNVYADFISSTGNIKNQDYLQFNSKAAGSYTIGKNELYGSAGFGIHEYHLYGYNHAVLNFEKKDVLLRYQNVSLKAGFRNKEQTEYNISYNPTIQVNLLNLQGRATENSFVVDAPIQKTFDEVWTVKITAHGDFTKYVTQKIIPNNFSISNNVYSIAPEIVYSKNILNIHVGISPTWDNGKLNVLPNIYGEVKVKEGLFLAQAGFVGKIVKNTLGRLSMINPFLTTITEQKNTRELELYGGIKATVGKHFNFSAKAGFVAIKNMPLFINDNIDGKTFYPNIDSGMNALRIHADMSYIQQEKFMLTGGVTFNGYSGMTNNARAWGTIPLEANASLRWKPFKQLTAKADFWAFAGSPYLVRSSPERVELNGIDLSAGLEFALSKKISLWLDVNNIFNNTYERWKNYQVYGLNVVGGAIVRF